MRQVKFAFCCDFLYFRSANIYSPKKGARCCNKSLTSSVLSFVVMYKRGVVMFGVVSLTMGNSVLPFRHRLSCHITCLSNVILCKLILFSVKLNIVTYQNKYLQFNLYPKLYRQVAESKENIGCKCATLGGLLFNLAFYVYKAYIFSVPRCSNGLNSSLKESDFDQSILETNVPNERIAFLGFT